MVVFGKKIFSKIIEKEKILISLQSLNNYISKTNSTLLLSSGEQIKTRKSKQMIEDWLITQGVDKSSKLVAMGGGALLDVVGFVAATLYRGIPFISIPTTLLAMTDAAIGGKVAINIGNAKNILGTFYQPESIYIDLIFLETLPEKEYLGGLSEVIKHSIIHSKDFFLFLKKNWEAILRKEDEVLFSLLKQSISIKQAIVKEDPYDKGKRRLLNFGHTLGHAFEAASCYQMSHGEAVRRGMIGEAYLSLKMAYLKQKSFDEIFQILTRFSFPCSMAFEEIKKALRFDKKNLNRKNRFVILEDIGKPLAFAGEYVTEAPESLIDEAIKYALCHS